MPIREINFTPQPLDLLIIPGLIVLCFLLSQRQRKDKRKRRKRKKMKKRKNRKRKSSFC